MPIKRCVILIPGFPASESDSTCLPMQQQFVKALKLANPSVDVVVLSFQYPYHAGEYSWFGIRVIPFGGRNRGGIRRLRLRQKILGVLQSLYLETPDLSLLSFWYGECAAVGHAFAEARGLKHFCWLMGQDARAGNKYPGRARIPARQLIALSDSIREEFEMNYGILPGRLVPPGIEPTLFSGKAITRDIDILGVGSLIPLKRYDLFIEVLASVKTHIPGIRAVLVGDGPERETLQTYAKKKNLEDNLRFLGELPYSDVLHTMQRARILLHTSCYEGFSGVCQEALYAGARVISFCRAVQEPIDHWQIVGSPDEMTQHAIHILQCPTIEHSPVLLTTSAATARNIWDLFQKD